MSKKWSKHPIMNQMALHKSNVIDKLSDYQTKPKQTTQTGLIKWERHEWQNCLSKYFKFIWCSVDLHHIGRHFSVCVCVRAWQSSYCHTPYLTHMYTQYSLFLLAIYVILILSKINTHKCKTYKWANSFTCEYL